MMKIWNNGIDESICQHFSQNFQINIQFKKEIVFKAQLDDQYEFQSKFQVQSKFNQNECQSTHYIIMLDDSRSMEGQKWENAKNGTLKFMKQKAKYGEARVSVIIFNHDARVVIDCEKVDIDKQEDLITYEGGGTNFNNAFLKAYDQLINHVNNNFDKIIILFYTDGSDRCPADETNLINCLKIQDKLYNQFLVPKVILIKLNNLWNQLKILINQGYLLN